MTLTPSPTLLDNTLPQTHHSRCGSGCGGGLVHTLAVVAVRRSGTALLVRRQAQGTPVRGGEASGACLPACLPARPCLPACLPINPHSASDTPCTAGHGGLLFETTYSSLRGYKL
jgi:hypothetical protein